MRVLHIVRHLHKLSGVSVYCSGLCDALAKNGVDVTIGVANMADSNRLESDCGVPRMQVDRLFANKGVWDVVHIHNLWTPDLHRAAVWARRFDIPVVWSLHGTLSPWSFKFKWWKKCLPWYLYQKRDLKSAAVLHVTSDGEAQWVRDAGFGDYQIAKIPMGTEIRPAVVRKYDIHRLLFVGRIAPVKSLEKLIQAWAKVDRANWRLRIVGIEDFAGYTDSLKALCKQLGVADSIDFVGQKFGPDLEDEYAQADALALVSETENFGAVVADALAWGLPVVTSKGTPWKEVEGVAEVVVGSGSGTVEEREGRGRDTRSTVEFGSPAISRRLLAEKKVDEWLRGVTRESFVSALGKLVEEKTAAGEYCFRRSEERGLALKGAARFYDEFSRKIIPLSDGRCVYFTPDARSKVRNGNDLSRCWAEYAFHAVSNGGRRIAGKEYNERWYHPHKASNFSQIVQTVTKERCYVRLRDNSRNDSILFYGEVVSGLSFDVVTRLDEFGNIGANLTEVTVEVSSRGEKKPPRLVPLTEAVQTVVHHQTTAGSYPSDTCNISNSLGLRNGLPFAAEAEGRGRDTGSAADGGDLDPEALASNENTESHHCRPRISTSTSSRCGWWVENDPETLAKALRELMALSDEDRQAMGAHGRELVREKYSWAAVADRMKEVYESLIRR